MWGHPEYGHPWCLRCGSDSTDLVLPLFHWKLWRLHRSEMSIAVPIPWGNILNLHTCTLRRWEFHFLTGDFSTEYQKDNRLPRLFPGEGATSFWTLLHKGAVLPVACVRPWPGCPSPSSVRTQTTQMSPSVGSHVFIPGCQSVFGTPQGTLVLVLFCFFYLGISHSFFWALCCCSFFLKCLLSFSPKFLSVWS